ncbi:DUF721 domain-containing protein [Gilliamella sp. B14384G15]|uniref:DUF721 domain-containing protein n=1 Tax=unclassified Gilliamella TaxID=2685620 RepID=UPI0018DDE39A|nr:MULTISPECIES: DciA family protein [unclassified Gilliamella]MBI0030318.1 DUF721 domain-containing protein [Gilliamella sp. B14384G15]MBI0057050.1 DUF721 domain-containing protein [Gilliamella sp. B14384G12]
MRYNEPQMLTSILSQQTCLSEIKEKTFALNKLADVINELLPSLLRQQYRIANYRQGVLILEVSSASWLTRLRYEQSNLLSEIRKQILPSLSSIQYKINPDISSQYVKMINDSSKSVTITRALSPQSAIYLSALAESAPDKLKKQLIKLANHAK